MLVVLGLFGTTRTADFAASVLVVRVLGRVVLRFRVGLATSHLGRVSGCASESLTTSSPAVTSTLAIWTGALARRAFARGWAAFVLVPCLSHSLSGLPSQFRNHASLACERFSVTGPTVHPALTIGTGARTFALAIAESAWTTCVLAPRLALVFGCFSRHFWAVIAIACVWLAIASPTVFFAVGSGTGTPGGFTNSIIFAGTFCWGAVITVGGKLWIFETCVRRTLQSEASCTRCVSPESTAVFVFFTIFHTLGCVMSIRGLGGVASVIVRRGLLSFVCSLPTHVRRGFQPVAA